MGIESLNDFRIREYIWNSKDFVGDNPDDDTYKFIKIKFKTLPLGLD